jgi:hypothetical protein
LSYSPKEAYAGLVGHLPGLKTIVEQGPLGAMPVRYSCACGGIYCMRPLIELACEKYGIPRLSFGLDRMEESCHRWFLLLPRILKIAKEQLMRDTDPIKLNYAIYAMKFFHPVDGDDYLRSHWEINDLNSLAIAVSIPETGIYRNLLSLIDRGGEPEIK